MSFLKSIIGVAALAMALAVTGCRQDRDAMYEKALVKASAKINEGLPKSMDAETRLDNTIPGPGKKFTYVYTLVKREKATVDIAKLEAAMRPKMITFYKTTDQMKTFREGEVELHYKYNDKNGVFLLEIAVNPKDF